MIDRVDMLCKHIAADLTAALTELSSNFGARMTVVVCRNVDRHIEGAISVRAELLVMACADNQRAREACARAFTLITWVEDYAELRLQRVLDNALDKSAHVQRELTALRDQVDRAARSVLATTHGSRRRT